MPSRTLPNAPNTAPAVHLFRVKRVLNQIWVWRKDHTTFIQPIKKTYVMLLRMLSYTSDRSVKMAVNVVACMLCELAWKQEKLCLNSWKKQQKYKQKLIQIAVNLVRGYIETMNVKQQQEEQVQEKEERKHYMCHFLSSTNNQLCSTHKNIMFISNNIYYFFIRQLSLFVLCYDVPSVFQGKSGFVIWFRLDLLLGQVKVLFGQRIGLTYWYYWVLLR